MQQQMQERLAALRSEHEKGQIQLRNLELQSQSLRETLLRISGAIVVLEELLSSSAGVASIDEQQLAASEANSKPHA
jgi:hypothetical protein